VKPSTSASPRAGRRNPAAGHLSEISVRGLAFGQEPKAVIEVEGTTKIVAAGDFIDGTRISSILADRIVLNDGSVLMFARAQP